MSTRSEHIEQLRSPLLAEGLDLFDRIMAAAGTEGRYPFFDRRLAEYCVSLPGDQKLASGYSRIVARRALEGIVPHEALWRAGKGRPGLHIIPALKHSRQRLDEIFLKDPSALAPFLDIRDLQKRYRTFCESAAPDLESAIRLWSAASAALWLRNLR